jgi:hypothetical protein
VLATESLLGARGLLLEELGIFAGSEDGGVDRLAVSLNRSSERLLDLAYGMGSDTRVIEELGDRVASEVLGRTRSVFESLGAAAAEVFFLWALALALADLHAAAARARELSAARIAEELLPLIDARLEQLRDRETARIGASVEEFRRIFRAFARE